MVTTLPDAPSSKAAEARTNAPEAEEEPPPPYESLDPSESHAGSHVASTTSSRVNEQVASLLSEHMEPSGDSRSEGLDASRHLGDGNAPGQTVDHKYSEQEMAPRSDRGDLEQQPAEPSLHEQGYPHGNSGQSQAGYPQAGHPQAQYPPSGYLQAGHSAGGYPQYPVPQGALHADNTNAASAQGAGWASSVGSFFGSMGTAISQRHGEIQDRRQDRREIREERREARQNYRELKKEQRQERREARRESRH